MLPMPSINLENILIQEILALLAVLSYHIATFLANKKVALTWPPQQLDTLILEQFCPAL